MKNVSQCNKNIVVKNIFLSCTVWNMDKEILVFGAIRID